MNGIINARQPSATAEGGRETGVAFEQMVALCNETRRNLWINVPHLARDDFITRLAKLIRFGSDGVNPYDAPQASPVFAPLRGDLFVYVEFSNEIWSSGFDFPQGNWAEEQAVPLGLTNRNSRRGGSAIRGGSFNRYSEGRHASCAWRRSSRRSMPTRVPSSRRWPRMG